MARLAGLVLSVALMPVGAWPQQALIEPQSCTAAESARNNYLAHVAHPAKSDLWLNYSMADVRASRKMREEADRKQMDELSKLCLGDLTAARQYDEAISKAAHFGMLDEAERIARVRALVGQAPTDAPGGSAAH